jgi:hypothetical protein
MAILAPWSGGSRGGEAGRDVAGAGGVHDDVRVGEVAGVLDRERTLLVVPASSRAWQWPDHVAVPVVDAPDVTTVIAWPASSRSRAVADLVRSAAGLVRRHPLVD